MKFVRRVFLVAAIYGFVSLVPLYFAEPMIAKYAPPGLTHPEHFYGFIGVALAWQVLFLMIARDPLRLHSAMVAAVLEKLAFAIPVVVLYAQQRLAGFMVAFGLIDLALAVLFTIAYLKCRRLAVR